MRWRLIPLLLGLALLPEPARAIDLKDMILDPGHLAPTENSVAVHPGDMAPDFTLPGLLLLPGANRAEQRTFRLSEYRGQKNVVLSFVPAAFTPVCSDQWPGYQLAQEIFEEADAVILGISVDNLPSLNAWVTEMHGLWFPVLSDFWPHGAVAKAYGLLRANGTAERAIIIIDKQGVVRYAEITDINTRPDLGHIAAALGKLGGPKAR
ncbi:MAG: peroxiredoxin [Humidesulfovibrio sp.]|nr:peroxiredoxin [Humidesulfovibrio sp.]